MPAINWEFLSKSGVDPELIEESINRLIAAHNDDESAHLEVGQSLQSHKASEIIDHLAESVVADKVSRHFFPSFFINATVQSLDAFHVSAYSSENGLGGIFLCTSTVLNNLAYVSSKCGNVLSADFSKNPVTDMRIKVTANGTYESYFGIGDRAGWTDEYFAGFKVVNGSLYARCYSVDTGNETLVAISGVTVTAYNFYRVEVETCVEARFYVNDVLKATIATNVPSAGISAMMYCDIKTTQTGHQGYLYIAPFCFQQDL